MTTPLQFLAGAKALQGEGASLPVQLSGRNAADDATLALSATTDDEGKGVLRIVDAAPFAYDAGSERLKVQSQRVLEMQVLDNTLNVAAAGSHTVTVTPPAGEIWRVKMLGMNTPAPSGAASGTHKVELYSGISANVNEYMMFQAISNYADNVRLRMNTAFTATSAVTPTDQAVQIAVLTSIVISEDIPLQIKYTNSTNATATGNWAIKLLVEKETVDS